MFRMTTGAADHLKSIAQRREDLRGRTPRLARDSGQLRLGYAEASKPGDKVVEASGVKLFVAPDVTDDLDTATIDVRRESDGKEALVLRNDAGAPAAT